MADECWLGKDPFPEICCCTCHWHKRTYENCNTNPLLRKEIARKIQEEGGTTGKGGGCICDVQNGWACVVSLGGEEPRIYINWPEHSCGCELHITEEQYKERFKREEDES